LLSKQRLLPPTQVHSRPSAEHELLHLSVEVLIVYRTGLVKSLCVVSTGILRSLVLGPTCEVAVSHVKSLVIESLIAISVFDLSALHCNFRECQSAFSFLFLLWYT